MDAMGAATEIHTRGSDVIRILPRVNDEVNEEWISDKSRHAFDGLKKQRLTVPMVKKDDGSFAELKWPEAMTLLSKKLKSYAPTEMAGMIGTFTDIETITAFRDLMHRLNVDNIDARTNAPKLGSADFRAQYLFNSRIPAVEEADLVLLVGGNLRSESPVLNARLRKAVGMNGTDVGVVGNAADLAFDYQHLGNTSKTLQEIADGTHPYAEKIRKAERAMIIVSAAALERSDGEAVLAAVNKIGENTSVVSQANYWNGINILHNEISRAGALDLGVTTNWNLNHQRQPKLLYLIGADNFREEDIPSDAYVIYQGHTGDEGAYFADLIIPSASPIEKQGSYVNFEGRVQQTRAAIAPPGHAREDWMILRALSEELGTPLPYDSLDELRNRIAELAPHLVLYEHIEPSGFEELAILHNQKTNQKLLGTPFADPIDNFYMTDSISRTSSTMAKCTEDVNPKKHSNFRKTVYEMY